MWDMLDCLTAIGDIWTQSVLAHLDAQDSMNTLNYIWRMKLWPVGQCAMHVVDCWRSHSTFLLLAIWNIGRAACSAIDANPKPAFGMVRRFKKIANSPRAPFDPIGIISAKHPMSRAQSSSPYLARADCEKHGRGDERAGRSTGPSASRFRF